MKRLFICLTAACALLISGCASNGTSGVSASAALPAETPPSASLSQSAQASSAQNSLASPAKPQASPSAEQPSGSPTGSETVQNPYFFNNGVAGANYQAIFSFDEPGKGDAALQINKIEDLNRGTVYELKLNAVQGIPADRLSLGYFYVQQNKIYKTDPTQDSLKILETDELPCACFIVCQEDAAQDSFEDQPGFHQYITADGDKREYHSYNDETETGYYESFTWERGKGLISYRSGYGAEKDSIELDLNE